MKRLLILGAVLVLAVGMSLAGDYHFGDTLKCVDCHVMHASLQHGYNGSTVGYPQDFSPGHEYLLKGGINETCLICHDADSAPDVVGQDDGYFLTNRSAGALNDNTAPQGYQTWMGHTLGSTDTAPGEAGSFVPDAGHGLTCVDCHAQHGYHGGADDVEGNPIEFNDADGDGNPDGAYRNLAGLGGFGNAISISYRRGAGNNEPLVADVYEDYSNAYETFEVNLNEPVQTDSGFGEWCGKCHVNFHGPTGVGAGPDKYLRHPAANANIGAVGGGHSSLGVLNGRAFRVRVMAETGVWYNEATDGDYVAGDAVTPTCLSCHKAHGNKQAFGLIYALGDAALGEDGDGTTPKQLCGQCHVQG